MLYFSPSKTDSIKNTLYHLPINIQFRKQVNLYTYLLCNNLIGLYCYGRNVTESSDCEEIKVFYKKKARKRNKLSVNKYDIPL